MSKENTKKAAVSFENLRTITQINNKDLLRMDKDIKNLLVNLDGINRQIRNSMRSLSEQKMQKVRESAEIQTEIKETPQVEKKVIEKAQPEVRSPRPAYPSQESPRPFANQQRPFRDQQNRPPRPFNQGQVTGASTPNRTARPGGTTEAARPTFAPTQKRVFDKKKDNDKRDRDFDRGKSKRSLMRRGLIEESSIAERIMGSRKIRSKKLKEEPVLIQAKIEHAIINTENLTVKQLSERTGRTVSELLKQLMVLGIMSNVNSAIDFPTAELVASELGVVLEQKLEKTYEEKLADEFSPVETDSKNSVVRPPIVAVLGHVDHGKTSLLDYIRSSHIASGEAGGITQNISAYQIEKKGKKITFIDTPGHEAFSAMRARGASVTDVAILVVAADDGIKPQTLEAIKHIKEAKVPMLVAVNKMDKQEANFERVKEQLAKYEIIAEDWGGDTIILPISALTGSGVEKLLEMILLVADMQELKADPTVRAQGMVIEAKLDKGKGPVATAIILNGSLKVGDTVISGVNVGKVRAILDDKGASIRKALPSAPVAVLGLDGVPNAGDNFYVVDEKMSKQVLAERKRKVQTDKVNTKPNFSIEEFLAKSADSDKKVLNLIVKTDVQGSFEALTEILNNISNDEVRVECIHGGVGAINENDVLLAKSAKAILVGFNVKPDSKSGILIEHEKLSLFLSKIIYQVIEYVEKVIKSMREPVFEERIIGHAEVIRTFKISRLGTIAGCIMKDGKIMKNAKIRLFRGEEKLADTSITTLQREKQDVKEVVQGMECGIKLEGHNDILVGDKVEAYIIEEIQRD